MLTINVSCFPQCSLHVKSPVKQNDDGRVIFCVTLAKLAFFGHEAPVYSL